MLYKLESLRGIAALLVVIHHIEWGFPSSTFVHYSLYFVDLFFVLSGFVMTMAYKQKIAAGMNFSHFAYLRLARLYPLHIAVLLMWIPYICVKYYLYASGFGGVDPAKTENPLSFVVVLFLLNSVGLLDYLSWNVPSWSIGTELIAYTYFFIAIAACKKFKYSTTIFFALTTIICYSYLYATKGTRLGQITDLAPYRCVGAFSLGVLLFSASTKPIKNKYCINLAEISSVIAVIGSIMMINVYNHFVFATILSFVYAVYVFSQKNSGYIGGVLEHNIPKALGRWSYSIYMTHMLFISAISDAMSHIFKLTTENTQPITFILINTIVILLIIGFSAITYNAIENPARIYLNRKINSRKIKIDTIPSRAQNPQ